MSQFLNIDPKQLKASKVKTPLKKIRKTNKGVILIFVLVFTAVFVIIGGGILQLVGMIHKVSIREQNLKKTFQIAEAGINYYRWRLAHKPEDYGGAGDYNYQDPYGDIIGYYTLEITPPPQGSTIVKVKSTGHLNEDPSITRTIEVRLGRRAFSDYAFLTNNSAWFGEGEEISGKTHTNTGIRMDGESDSTIDSPNETYRCYPIHGCSSPYEIKPGVWGEGEIKDLWRFPPKYSIDPINFGKVTEDLGDMKTTAQENGIYLGKSGSWGYHLHFNFNDTIQVYKVTSVYPSLGWDYTDGWQWRYIDLRFQSLIGTYTLPASGIIFVEDNVWVDGEIDGRATVVSANLDPNIDPTIIINDNITYRNKNGSSVLGLLAEKDILLPLRSPDKLEIDAALLAQKGHVFIYYYPAWLYGSNQVIKDKIELYGAITTNAVWTWSWVASEGGPVISGYQRTETTYDPYLTYAPPPYFPTKDEYELISWREIP